MSYLPSLYTNETLTMTSRQIADYTGKMHQDVLRDIRNMLVQLETTASSFAASYKDPTGRTLPMFALPKDLTITLISGYSAPMRFAIVKRWEELEAKEAKTIKVPTNFREALLLAASQLEQLEVAQQQLAIDSPKAAVFDACIADTEKNLTSCARKLRGINSRAIKSDLTVLGYLYKKGRDHRVYGPYRDVLFKEDICPIYGGNTITVLPKGVIELERLHREGRLTMKTGGAMV